MKAKLLAELLSSDNVPRAISILSDQFAMLGFSVQILNFSGVLNLFAYKNLDNKKPTIMYLGHADVVPPAAGTAQGVIQHGAVWGRGAVDMKGSIVCFLSALRLNPDASVVVIISGDEEGTAEFGTPAVLRWLRSESRMPQIDFVLIGEPTSVKYIGDRVKVGCRGSLNVELKCDGVAGHVAYPDFAKNPITSVINFINNMCCGHTQSQKELPAGGTKRRSGVHEHPSTGSTNWESFGDWVYEEHLEITSFESDSGAVNVIPSSARCRFNIRFEQGGGEEHLISRILKLGDQFGIQVEYDVASRPCMTMSTPVRLIQAIEAVTGIAPEITTGGANSDAKFICEIAPFAELGLKVELAHKADEHVSLKDMDILTNIYDRFLRGS
jgi:succinyl-diaminopimelate desuccinylase